MTYSPYTITSAILKHVVTSANSLPHVLPSGDLPWISCLRICGGEIVFVPSMHLLPLKTIRSVWNR